MSEENKVEEEETGVVSSSLTLGGYRILGS